MPHHARRVLLLLVCLLVATALASAGLTAALLFPFPERATRTPADLGLVFEPVTFHPPTGVTLKGWFMPNAASHGRTVLVLHGISANKSVFVDRGADVQRLGYNVVMVDLRHHGESTGAITTYGYEEAQDVMSVIKTVEQRPDVRPGGVVVVGYSMGAAIALQTLADPDVRAVAADSAFTDLHSIMAYRGHQWHVPDFMQPLCEWEVGMVAFNVDQVSPLRCLAASQKPVLLIQGTDDESVPITMGRTLAAAGDPHETFWEVPQTGHVAAAETHHAEYVRRLGAFLKSAF
jgi:hypothetical protein